MAIVVRNEYVRTIGYDGWTERGGKVGYTALEVEAAHPRVVRIDDPYIPNNWYLSAPYINDENLAITYELAGQTVTNFRAGYRRYSEDPYVCSVQI